MTKESFMAAFQAAVGQVVQIAMHIFWKDLKKRGLTMPQMFAMRYLYYRGESNISELARELGVTNAAASQMLDRLVGQGYILRLEDPQDRRNKKLTLTDKGRALLQESDKAQRRWLEALADAMSPEEMAELARAMEILADRASELSDAENVKRG
jgi:DNA-binding MarR family transcriptional regulator